jgi:hypothetical protein
MQAERPSTMLPAPGWRRPNAWAARRRCLLPAAAALCAFSLCAAAARADDSAEDLAERRGEIERMTPVERQHLRHSELRFAKFSLDEQRRMLKLEDELERDPRGEELRRVMVRYHEWLDTLSLSVRADLLELGVDERIAKIKQLKQQQAAARDIELQQAPTEQDLKSILGWIEGFAWQQRESLLKTLSPARQQYLSGLDEAKLRRAMLWLLVHHWHWGQGQMPNVGAGEIAELTGKLSPAAQHRLAAAHTPQEKFKLIGDWTQVGVRHRVDTGGIRKLLPPIDGQELQRFLREELNAEQREWLLPLSRDQRHRLLLRMYFQTPQRLALLRPGQPGWPGGSDGLKQKDPEPNDRPKTGRRQKSAA